MIRTIILYTDNFVEFYDKQNEKVQSKIEYVLDLIRFEQHVPIKFFKYLKNSDGIYEVRVITTFKSIRILCFMDEGKLVVLTNCFIKKTQKTPRKEIKLAERLKTEYFNEKTKKDEKYNHI